MDTRDEKTPRTCAGRDAKGAGRISEGGAFIAEVSRILASRVRNAPRTCTRERGFRTSCHCFRQCR